MQFLMTATVVIDGLGLSVAIAILAEELIFGKVFGLFFTPLAAPLAAPQTVQVESGHKR